MKTQTFSFILELKGGTYLSQYRGRSPREALRKWAARERQRLVGQWQSGLSNEFFDAFLGEAVVPIEGMAGMWCATVTIGDDFGLVNIVRTAE